MQILFTKCWEHRSQIFKLMWTYRVQFCNSDLDTDINWLLLFFSVAYVTAVTCFVVGRAACSGREWPVRDECCRGGGHQWYQYGLQFVIEEKEEEESHWCGWWQARSENFWFVTDKYLCLFINFKLIVDVISVICMHSKLCRVWYCLCQFCLCVCLKYSSIVWLRLYLLTKFF